MSQLKYPALFALLLLPIFLNFIFDRFLRLHSIYELIGMIVIAIILYLILSIRFHHLFNESRSFANTVKLQAIINIFNLGLFFIGFMITQESIDAVQAATIDNKLSYQVLDNTDYFWLTYFNKIHLYGIYVMAWINPAQDFFNTTNNFAANLSGAIPLPLSAGISLMGFVDGIIIFLTSLSVVLVQFAIYWILVRLVMKFISGSKVQL